MTTFTKFTERVTVVMTVPKPVLRDDLKARKLTAKGMLFDRDECLVEDEDPDGYYGNNDIMSMLVFSRTLDAEEAVRLAEKALRIKGTSGDAIIDIKYLFKRLHAAVGRDVTFDLYNADVKGNVSLYHSEGSLILPFTSSEIPNVLNAIRGGTTTEEKDRRRALGWLLDEFGNMPYSKALEKIDSLHTAAEMKYALAETYHDAGSRFRALEAA